MGCPFSVLVQYLGRPWGVIGVSSLSFIGVSFRHPLGVFGLPLGVLGMSSGNLMASLGRSWCVLKSPPHYFLAVHTQKI